MQTYKCVDKDDGRWWIRCKSCKHDEAVLMPRPDSVQVNRDRDIFKHENQMNVSFEAKLVCANCNGEIELYRVEVSGTIES